MKIRLPFNIAALGLATFNLSTTVIEAQFLYITNNGTIIITGYTGPGGAVTIPSFINGLPVTTIGNSAFYNWPSITSVTMPTTLTGINYAAFDHCGGLTSVTIGNNVTNIGASAFQNCDSLTTITIPANVTTIGKGPLNYCTNLTAITVEALNSAYTSVDGVLFNKSQTALIQFPGGKAGGYTLPTSVTSIADWAFHGCLRLTKVEIPDSVTNIGQGAFETCGLTSVSIPKSITSIGIEAFCACGSLTNVMIPNGITNIDQLAFYECTSLPNITIPPSVASIGSLAFVRCYNLTAACFQGDAPSAGSFPFDSDYQLIVYYLPATYGWSATFGGRPAMLWNPIVRTSDGSFGVRSNRFGFTVTGTAGIPMVIEACTNPPGGSWSSLQTCTLTNGSIYFSDAEWMNYAARFYRIRSP